MGKASNLASQLAGQLDRLDSQLDRVGRLSASLASAPATPTPATSAPTGQGIGRRDLRALEARIVRQLQPRQQARGRSFALAVRRLGL